MAALLKPRKEILEHLPGTEVVPQSLSLIFLPFSSTQHDIIHPDIGIAINRITSYNVCYTKLLRNTQPIDLVLSDVKMPGMSGIRITSYNVCYTKLLR